MQPKERRETGEQDLFRSRLDQIIYLQHALVRLARAIDWRFLEEKFGAVYTDKPGHPPLPTRLMAGLSPCSSTAYIALSNSCPCSLSALIFCIATIIRDEVAKAPNASGAALKGAMLDRLIKDLCRAKWG
jgi:hypothetical protein